jgi:hypothetical protein
MPDDASSKCPTLRLARGRSPRLPQPDSTPIPTPQTRDLPAQTHDYPHFSVRYEQQKSSQPLILKPFTLQIQIQQRAPQLFSLPLNPEP